MYIYMCMYKKVGVNACVNECACNIDVCIDVCIHM